MEEEIKIKGEGGGRISINNGFAGEIEIKEKTRGKKGERKGKSK